MGDHGLWSHPKDFCSRVCTELDSGETAEQMNPLPVILNFPAVGVFFLEGGGGIFFMC